MEVFKKKHVWMETIVKMITKMAYCHIQFEKPSARKKLASKRTDDFWKNKPQSKEIITEAPLWP